MTTVTNLSNLAKNLRFLRKASMLKEEEIGLNLGITGSAWSNYENGTVEPDVNDIIKISKFFKLTLDDLMLTDLSKNSPVEIEEASVEKEIKLIQQELAAQKKEIEYIKKIIARR